MRVILWLVLVLGVLWGGYWFVGSSAIKSGTKALLDDLRAQGMLVEQTGLEVTGFPSRFDLTLTEPHFGDPQSGWAIKAPFAQVLAMTWKPWHVIAVLPQEVLVNAPRQQIAVSNTKLQASLRVQPSSDLTLDELVLEANDLDLQSDLGWQTGASRLVMALAREEVAPLRYRLGLDIADLLPDPALTARLPNLGAEISSVRLDSTITLSAPLDRNVRATRPALTGLKVLDFQVAWGTLHVLARGEISPGLDGLAEGQIDFQVEGWRELPELLVALGLVRPEMGKSLSDGLEVVALSGGDPTTLSLPLVFADGWISLGPLPLGPAPLLQ